MLTVFFGVFILNLTVHVGSKHQSNFGYVGICHKWRLRFAKLGATTKVDGWQSWNFPDRSKRTVKAPEACWTGTRTKRKFLATWHQSSPTRRHVSGEKPAFSIAVYLGKCHNSASVKHRGGAARLFYANTNTTSLKYLPPALMTGTLLEKQAARVKIH